jgi:hypothetical protein
MAATATMQRKQRQYRRQQHQDSRSLQGSSSPRLCRPSCSRVQGLAGGEGLAEGPLQCAARALLLAGAGAREACAQVSALASVCAAICTCSFAMDHNTPAVLRPCWAPDSVSSRQLPCMRCS